MPGLGRGAAGFTTRSDIGPAAVGAAAEGGGSGSRAAEARNIANGPTGLPFGAAPRGYVAGSGRGAGGGSVGAGEGGPSGYDPFGGYDNGPANQAKNNGGTPYDREDEEADRIYDSVDERMSRRGGGKRARHHGDEDEDDRVTANSNNNNNNGSVSSTDKIGKQFRELKERLKDVTEDQWDAIPDVGDYSLKYKQRRREDVFTPLPDSVLAAKSTRNTADSHRKATATVTDGFRSVVSNMSGLAEARGTVLGMSLDRQSAATTGDQAAGTAGGTTVDPNGYLTSLSSVRVATDDEIGDVHKARLLLKSVRDTNPRHAPGWIAAARVEEAADQLGRARRLIQTGCTVCPESEDVWLEAARLHPPHVAKTILATAVRRLPQSVRIFLRAAESEQHTEDRRRVLRKALENVPDSVVLWKAAVELEDAEDARILLSVAVEKVPHAVDMWLALARLETHDNARKVLNRARKQLPSERSVWIAAAKLEEANVDRGDGGVDHSKKKNDTTNNTTNNNCSTNINTTTSLIDRIISKAVRSLSKSNANTITREQWMKEATSAELQSKAPLTSAAIVKHTVGLHVEPEDRQRTWSADAAAALSLGAVATARAVLAHALTALPTRRGLWLQAVELERRYGNDDGGHGVDEVLAAASERLPRSEIFWLLRAKEKWTSGDVEAARSILTRAFEANPDSEAVWLAGAKLEWETGEVERARVLLERARERAPSARVYMKGAQLEDRCKEYDAALHLLEEGIARYPTFDKLYMMGGQLCGDTDRLDRARRFYQRGLERCPDSDVVWTLASRLEERQGASNVTKARSLLELARLKNPRHPRLWLHSVRLERRAGNDTLAATLLARAHQECPTDGSLLAEGITTAPRVERKGKSADAVRKCPDDPAVIAAVACLFADERKDAKARKWLERAVVLDPDRGDSWALYYKFESERGTVEQRKQIKDRCVAAEPKHGEVWCCVMKDRKNLRKSTAEGLELVVEHMLQQQQG